MRTAEDTAQGLVGSFARTTTSALFLALVQSEQRRHAVAADPSSTDNEKMLAALHTQEISREIDKRLARCCRCRETP